MLRGSLKFRKMEFRTTNTATSLAGQKFGEGKKNRKMKEE